MDEQTQTADYTVTEPTDGVSAGSLIGVRLYTHDGTIKSSPIDDGKYVAYLTPGGEWTSYYHLRGEGMTEHMRELGREHLAAVRVFLDAREAAQIEKNRAALAAMDARSGNRCGPCLKCGTYCHGECDRY